MLAFTQPLKMSPNDFRYLKNALETEWFRLSFFASHTHIRKWLQYCRYQMKRSAWLFRFWNPLIDWLVFKSVVVGSELSAAVSCTKSSSSTRILHDSIKQLTFSTRRNSMDKQSVVSRAQQLRNGCTLGIAFATTIPQPQRTYMDQTNRGSFWRAQEESYTQVAFQRSL